MHARSRHAGFTMVELVVTLVVIGILGAVVAPRFFDRGSFDARAFADQAQALLRAAQKTAAAQNRDVYVRLNGTSVALCFDAACSAPASLVPSAVGGNSGSPATKAACTQGTYRSGWACEGVPAGLSYTVTPAFTAIRFDPLGQPWDGSTPLTSALTIQIAGGGATRTLTVEAGTGYVH